MTTVDYMVLGGYLVLMVIVGLMFRNKSHNNSDYIRLGAKGTWWLTGLSVFMQSFSVATFTGIAGQAYLGGWSAMSVTWCAALGMFIQAIFFARWMRQTRAITPGDAVYLRFGRTVEQIFMYVGTATSMFWGGFMLLGLATFLTVLFKIEIPPMWGFDFQAMFGENVGQMAVILVIGVVIIFYSVSGGSWSVQVTDSLQSFILLPVTIAVAGLCLYKVGGPAELLHKITEQGLAQDFTFLKPIGYRLTGGSGAKMGAELFTWPWYAAMLLITLMGAANMTTCYRYLATKDGRESSKAAWLAGGLLLAGSFIFYIPAIVGRVMYMDDIEAVKGVSNVADGAYAIVAMNVLPRGVLGLVLIAMFSAAMSSMDSFLTGTAGLITNNIYPPLARLFGFRELQGKPLMTMTKIVNLLLGVWSMAMAMFLLKTGGKEGIFKVMQTIVVLVAGPVGTPFVVSFFVKRLPSWGPIVGMAFGWVASVTIWLMTTYYGVTLSWAMQVFIMAAATIIPTCATILFWQTTDLSYRDRVTTFFRTINTPIDFRKEVGKEEDVTQLTTVGGLGIVMGLVMLPLIFVAETIEGRVAAAFVPAFVIAVSALLYFWGRMKGAVGVREELEHALHGEPLEERGADDENATGGGNA